MGKIEAKVVLVAHEILLQQNLVDLHAVLVYWTRLFLKLG